MRHLVIAILSAMSLGAAPCVQCDAQIVRRNSGWNISSPLHQAQPAQPVQPHYPRQYSPSFDPNRKVDGANFGMYNIGRVPEFPQGEDKLVCWVVLSPNYQNVKQERDIAVAVHSDPRMQAIKQNTHFNYYLSTSPLFLESGLVEKVGTATPIVVVSGPDGKILADGTAGMFVNAKSCPKTAGGVVDMICDSVARFNPPIKVEGQTEATPFVRETASVSQCGPDGCKPPSDPFSTPPPKDGSLTSVVPSQFSGDYNVLSLFGGAVVLAFLIYLGVRTPGAKK